MLAAIIMMTIAQAISMRRIVGSMIGRIRRGRKSAAVRFFLILL
jgi:hypothetical protein